jgi:succinate-acetate transporter protein
MESIQEVKVQTKDWANPTPAGLVALAVACFCFFALLNGYVEKTAMPLIGCWLIGGFVIQVIVGVLDLKGRNHAGGNTFLFFSAFFMLAAGLEMFVKSTMIADASIDGFVWVALTMVIWMWAPAFCRPFGLLSIIVLALGIALPFLALLDLKLIPSLSASFAFCAAYALLFAALVAIYLCSALVVNTAYGREVYPVIKPKK